MIIMKASFEAGLAVFAKSAEMNEPVIFPTDTIYGIGAPLSSIEANKKIFGIKQRPAGCPFPILAGSAKQAERIADLSLLSKEAKRYIDKWPGPYTYILKSKPCLPDIYAKNGTVAIRVPGEEWLRSAIEAFGEPITATSVNISKEPPLNDFKRILSSFGNSVSLFINGKTKTGASSEIIDLTNTRIVKVR